jgi:Flp pilus assembly protein TadD
MFFRKNCLLVLLMMLVSSCASYPFQDIAGRFGGGKKLAAKSRPSAIEQAQGAEAQKALEAKDYVKAAMLFGQLSDNSPSNMDYALKYADSLRLAGNPVKARAVYDTVISAPDSRRAIATLEGKGLAYMQEANFNQASKLLTQVLAKDATRWKAINALGVILSLTKHTKEALEYYNVALQVSNNHPTVLNNMGLTYAISGDLKQAIATLEKASASISSDQRKPIALNLAMVYGLAGRMSEAESVSKPYLTKAAIYNNIGYYAMLANNKALAREYLEKALSASPTHYQKAWDNMQKITS